MRIPDVESIKSNYDCVYISPHFDDATAGCGGRILAGRAAGERVLVVTAFGGTLPKAERPSSASLAKIVDTELRRAEDTASMELLGVDFLWLDHLDAIFRYRLPLARFRLQVSKRGADATLGTRLREDLRRICIASGARRLYAPLGVGQHIDHLIAARAAWELWQLEPELIELVFYEEGLYSFVPGALRYRRRLAGLTLESPEIEAGNASVRADIAEIIAIVAERPTLQIPKALIALAISLGVLSLELIVALASLGRRDGPTLRPEIVDVTACSDAKAAALLVYESQLHGAAAAIRQRYAEYSQKLGAGEGEARERYWHPVIPAGYPSPR